MSEVQNFQFESNEVRVHVDQAGELWWVATDVCHALGLTDASKTLERVPESHKGTKTIRTLGGAQQMLVVDEPGLYEIVFRSNKDEAKRFRAWVFEEVLPSIRQTGSYTHAPASNSNLAILGEVSQKLAKVATDHENRIARLEQRVERPLIPAELDLEEVRSRFAGALRDAIRESGDTDNMTSAQAAAYHQGINSKLKNVACNAKRANWDIGKYRLAVDYLRLKYGYDLRWIFGSSMEVA